MSWYTNTARCSALAGFGAIWLSVRGQHPYEHPSAAIAPLGLVLGVTNLTATLAVARRATTGLRARSRLHPAEIAIMVVVMAAVFAVMGGLAATGASDAIAYGLYPATVPLIAGGLAWAGIMARRASWRVAGSAFAIAVVGVAGTFAGAAGAWAVAAVACGPCSSARPSSWPGSSAPDGEP
ncbi:MAG TPA: hypothetical protein VG268_00185 [Streptosporangiaceae bacterium]|nr:hypothetical protein [Streptosporangiaceae bacterium]